MFARFYCSNSGNARGKHWASWESLCLPKDEGGTGSRSLHDVSKALFLKLWWNYRTKDTLWTTFMRNKYCKKINKVLVPRKAGSHVWKKILQMRDQIEHQIWWQLKSGNSYFLYDNWTGLGPLYHASGPDNWSDESIVHLDEVVENEAWNEDQLRDLVPDELANHIIETITPPSAHNQNDKPWWKLETKGKFSGKHPKEEALPHVFLKSLVAKFIWKYFSAPAGINIEGKQLVQVVNEWWRRPVNASLNPVYQAVPSLIIRRPNLTGVTANWPDLHDKLFHHIPKLKYIRVLWHLPSVGWIKRITDGACRGDNGGDSYGFCIRYGIGDLLYAQADSIEDATNNIAEAQTILEALRYMIQLQFPPCVIETNSLLMKKVLEEVWEPPWSIVQHVEEIKALMTRGLF
nr:uncharacterized protein LOC108946822 [Nicotiana tomentosiformis]